MLDKQAQSPPSQSSLASQELQEPEHWRLSGGLDSGLREATRAGARAAVWFGISLRLYVGEQKLGDCGGDWGMDGCLGRRAGQPGPRGDSEEGRD